MAGRGIPLGRSAVLANAISNWSKLWVSAILLKNLDSRFFSDLRTLFHHRDILDCSALYTTIGLLKCGRKKNISSDWKLAKVSYFLAVQKFFRWQVVDCFLILVFEARNAEGSSVFV